MQVLLNIEIMEEGEETLAVAMLPETQLILAWRVWSRQECLGFSSYLATLLKVLGCYGVNTVHGNTLPSQAVMEGSILVQKVKVHPGKRHVIFNT